MDIEQLRRDLENVNTEENNSVILYFVEKRRNGVTPFAPELSRQIKENIKTMYENTLRNNLFNLEQVAFNPAGMIEDTIEVSNLELGHAIAFINEIFNDPARQDMKEMDLQSVKFYIIEFNYTDEDGENRSFQIYNKFYKYNKLESGFKGFFTGNRFQAFDETIIGVDNKIDLLVYNNELLILNRASLQNIFNMRDFFIEQATMILERIRENDRINNFDQFRTECLEDRNLTKRFTKLLEDEGAIYGFFANYGNLPNVIEELDLEIELDDNLNINYRGGYQERLDIFKCIADKFFRTLMQGNLGEDRL